MSRERRGGIAIWLLACSLAAALSLTAVLAHEATTITQSHRALTGTVLAEYSAFAADQFARLAAQHLRRQVIAVVQPLACAASADGRRSAAHNHAHATLQASCPHGPAIAGYFEADATTNVIAFATGAAGSDVARIEAALRERSDSDVGLILLPGDTAAPVLGYMTVARPGGARVAIGFRASTALLATVFDGILDTEQLMPGSLVDVTANRSRLTVEIRDEQNHAVYTSGRLEDAAHIAERPLSPLMPGARVRLGLEASAAPQLVIGGTPASRLPLLLSLLGVTVGLVAISGWQVRREHHLARMRIDFVRSASHELRTPLAQIRMFAETLARGRVRSWDEARQSLDFIEQQSRRVSHLVDNLLATSSPHRSRLPNIEPIELNTFLDGVVRTFQPLARSARQNAILTHAGACQCATDREWLTQILLNLLDNAVKYGPRGQEIAVGLEVHDTHVRIIVEDQGPGVPAADRARIFEPFTRLDRDVERRTGGAGVGLSVVAHLVRALGGSVGVENGAVGAKFVVQLPLA